jgi:hypothetical protein
MKALNKILTISIFLLGNLSAFAQNELNIKWGLENKEYHEELTNSTANIRIFKPNKAYDELVYGQLVSKHWGWWDKYSTEHKNENTTLLQFSKYLEEVDPYMLGIYKKIAPSLYFDFTGKNSEYVLDSIEIKTLEYKHYKGGGFSINEAWYDIELKHNVGTYVYRIDKRLKFTGSGQAVLRFWSDNYVKNGGFNPSGEFKIQIIFHFISEGKKKIVSTKEFKIDV